MVARVVVILLGITIGFSSCKKEEPVRPTVTNWEIIPEGNQISTGQIYIDAKPNSVEQITNVLIDEYEYCDYHNTIFDSIFFFGCGKSVVFENDLLKPVGLTITEDRYWLRVFDEPGANIPYNYGDLELYRIDTITNERFLIPFSFIDSTSERISIDNEIDQSGVYMIGVPTSKLPLVRADMSIKLLATDIDTTLYFSEPDSINLVGYEFISLYLDNETQLGLIASRHYFDNHDSTNAIFMTITTRNEGVGVHNGTTDGLTEQIALLFHTVNGDRIQATSKAFEPYVLEFTTYSPHHVAGTYTTIMQYQLPDDSYVDISIEVGFNIMQ